MNGAIGRLRARFISFVWGDDLRTLDGARRFAIRTMRLVFAVGRDLLGGELNLRAMSLVYTTLLATVPLLAVVFSVLKAVGVHNQIEPLLQDFLAPLGPKANEVAATIIGFVESVQVGLLGTIGVLLLIYTAISLVQKIEESFNFAWHIQSLRSFGLRFSSYVSVLMIGPVLLFSVLGIVATLMNTSLMQKLVAIAPLGIMVAGITKLIHYLLVCTAFTLAYLYVPNTRVRVGPAAMGGLVAGFLWQSTGWVFAAFISTSTRYAAIYSSLAVVILLLIWLYLNWLILLLGAQISFYVQNPQYLTLRPARLDLSNRLKERLTLATMYLIGHNHYHGRAPWTVEALVNRLDLPAASIQSTLSMLREQAFIEPTGDDPPAYLPARDIGSIELTALLAATRSAGEGPLVREGRVLTLDPVDGVMTQVKEAINHTLSGTTLRDLVLRWQGEQSDHVNASQSPVDVGGREFPAGSAPASGEPHSDR